MAIITASEIKSKVDNRDLDTNLMTESLILMAQEKHIKPVLTEDLYNAFIADTSGYSDLLPIVKNALSWFVYWELMLVYYVSVTEQGFKFPNAQFTQNVGVDQYDSLKGWAYQTATKYVKDINENISDENYSLYDSSKKLQTTIIGGIIL
jgi:hypothetical protein